MRRGGGNRALVVALYVNAALLLALIVAVVGRGNGTTFVPAAYGAALSPQPIAGGANLYLMPAQFTQTTWGCYVLDIDAQSLCAYRYRPTNDGSDLQLVAVRKIAYDRKLTNFNTSPTPAEVKQLIDQAASGIRGQNNAATPPDQQSTTTQPKNTTEKTPGNPQ